MTDSVTRLERLATAVSSLNLKLDLERRMSVDHVIALGIASRKSDVTSKLLHLFIDRNHETLRTALEAVKEIVRRLNVKREWGLSDGDIGKVAAHAISLHINPVCSHCKGRGYHQVAGTPSLSHRACDHCKGAGRRQINKKLRTPIAATIASLEHIDSITEAAVGRYLR